MRAEEPIAYVSHGADRGSTCYMNALLQVMYMTPELRAGLFQVDPNELGFADVSAFYRVLICRNMNAISTQIMEAEREAIDAAASTPAVLVARPAPDVDASHLQMLMDMGFDEHGSRRALLAAKGGGVDGALNYYLEHSEDPGFLDPPAGTAAVASSAAPIVGGKKKRKPRLIPLELQRLFSQLQLLDVFAQSTTDLTSKGFQWEGVDGRVQHDAHELNR